MINVKKRTDLVVLGVLSVVMAFTWIGFGVYQSLTSPAEIDVPKDYLVPVKSEFDIKTLENLNQRLEISQETLEEFEAQVESEDLVQSQATQPTATQSATNSGTQSAQPLSL